MDNKPTNTPWFTKEAELLDSLLEGRISSEENDPNIPSLDRVQLYQWLSEQLRSQGGYNRSPMAIQKRLQGRLKFPRSPAANSKTPVHSHTQSNKVGTTGLSNNSLRQVRPSRSSSSSSDDIPLSQLRGNNRTVPATSASQTIISSSEGSGPPKKRVRPSDDDNDTITVLPRPSTQDPSFSNPGKWANTNPHQGPTSATIPNVYNLPSMPSRMVSLIAQTTQLTDTNALTIQNPNPVPHRRHEAVPNAPNDLHLAVPAPNTPPEPSTTLNDQRRRQLRFLAAKRVEELNIENKNLRQSKEARLLAKSQREDELRRLQVEMDRISGQIRDLDLKLTATAELRRQILSASQSDDNVLKDLDDRISESERGIKVFSEAASF